MKNYYVVLLFIALSFLFTEIKAQKNFNVKRGERPLIDLQNLPDDAYEKGIIKIKLNESFTSQLDDNPAIVDDKGIVRFNIINIDQLNQQYGAKDFNKLFESKAFSSKFSERHRAWGFHLWYTLVFDKKINIKKLVDAYGQLAEVTIAEPEYKKELIASEPVTFQSETKGDGKGPSSIEWTPNDPSYNQQWHYHNTGQQSGTIDADIDLPEAWDIERGNSNVIVCIEDMGVQYDHPDLAGNMWSGLGYDFYNDDATIEPGYHGTHVAGTVAAESNNGIGVSGVAGGTGANDGVRLMSCQVFSSDGYGGGFHLAPIYAADNDACISQNSWGYTSAGTYEQAVLDAIDYFNTNGGGAALSGGITIYAAGNSNSNGNYYPGYYSGTFAIAATNNQDVRSYYSNYGTWVDISAPGGETNSVTARGIYSTYTGSTYNYLQGTSMACPHTSGVAALIVSLAYGYLTSGDVASILRNTTDDNYAVNPGYVGELGTGRLNAYEALLETQNYLSGLLNPQTFTATPISSSQIDLGWTKNTNGNDVMVVWSLSSTIGTPVSGVVYTAGQTIPGGGTVLYRGSNTSVNHTGLSAATKYYYRAFSYDASNDYSSGKTASATTFCNDISSLPFAEDFSGGILPICWENVDNEGDGQVWQFNNPGSRTINTSSSANGFAILDSDHYGDGNSQNADLITPTLDLSAYTSINLYFEYYFKAYSGSSGTLSYSINGGISWISIQTWTATSASNPAIFNQDMTSQVAGQSNVKFKWNYTGSWGYYWAIDDISITGVSSGLWVGAASTDWNTGNNWDDGNIPVAGTDVSIPSSPAGGNYPETNSGSGAICANLTIETGAHLFIPSDNTLTVSGTLTNNAGASGLVIKSDVTGTGSLIHNTAGVSATVERYLIDGRWHFIGMPVNSANAGVFHLPSGHSDIYLYKHNEYDNSFSNIIPVTTPLELGRGYETWVGAPLNPPGGFTQPETIIFTGTLNTGDYTTGSGGFYGLQYTSTGGGHGLNMIANPYPSALQGNINTWSKTNLANSIWTWSKTFGNYVYWNGANGSGGGTGIGTMAGGVIPAMQGFFVEATGSSPSVTLPQTDRIHSSQVFYKDSYVPANTLKLEVEGNNYKDIIFVNFNEMASDSYDSQYDVKKLFGLDEAPQLYSIILNEKLSINSLSELLESETVQLGFECGVEGIFTIQAYELESFIDYTPVYLEDTKESIIQKLNDSPVYTFTHNPLDANNRFILHFGEPNGVEGMSVEAVTIYSDRNIVYVNKPADFSGYVFIYDMLGQEIITQKANGEGLMSISVANGIGYYVVKVQSDESIVTRKVFIR